MHYDDNICLGIIVSGLMMVGKNQSPKGNMWSAIPVALLCMKVNWSARKQGNSPQKGRSPREHRGTIVCSSVHPSVCLFVPPRPSQALNLLSLA